MRREASGVVVGVVCWRKRLARINVRSRHARHRWRIKAYLFYYISKRKKKNKRRRLKIVKIINHVAAASALSSNNMQRKQAKRRKSAENQHSSVLTLALYLSIIYHIGGSVTAAKSSDVSASSWLVGSSGIASYFIGSSEKHGEK